MSIPALVEFMTSDANHCRMSKTDDRRGKVTPENIAEAERLSAIWEETYAERKTRNLHSQGAFGLEYEIGNQAAVGFFLNGKTALSLKAARGFATGLKCNIADFSPRLAREAELAAAVANAPTGHATELARRIQAAPPETARLIELALLSETDLEKTKLSPSLKGLIGFVKHQIREETKGEPPTPS